MWYSDVVVVRSVFLGLQCATALAALASSSAAQLERELASRSQLVTGRVVRPDGRPAVGALVVTDAGAKAVTAADGSFTLEVALPRDAAKLEITAASDDAESGNLVASTTVVPAAFSGITPVGQLVLGPSAGCRVGWIPTFGAKAGTDGAVNALALFDAGDGQALYAAGDFSTAGAVAANDIARWDGTRWSSIGATFVAPCCSDAFLTALAVYDDGSGPALYVGGDFTSVNGVSANNIARWDGTSWSGLASGTNGRVNALAVHDDGGGPSLYAGGGFTAAGGVGAHQIARWDGSTWSALGSGVSNNVTALASYDDGSGPALVAAGLFTTAGGVGANRIAVWNGSSWSALGAGIGGSFTVPVHALAVLDDGGGESLFAGGDFSMAGTVASNRIARWDGSSWSSLGTGMNAPVRALAVHSDGNGPALVAGGSFTTAGGVLADRLAKWDGASWSALGGGVSSGMVAALLGSGGALFTGGQFDSSGGTGLNNVAAWNGASWVALGGVGLSDRVHALAVHDDGGGPALHAAGSFVSVGGLTANNVAKWDGHHWSALGGGMNGDVVALLEFDDGGGPALYAGGFFTLAGGTLASRVARWKNSSWSALGGGISSGTDPFVHDLAVFDDGGGPALYACGRFTKAGGLTVNHIAKWNGTSWSALGSGMSNIVHAVEVLDDGGGPKLYAGGSFTSAGGGVANRIAKWDGSSWSALGSGTNGDVYALAVHDDGSGPALYVGGSFSTAGGVAADRIARWDGTSWSALGAGIAGLTYVAAMTVHDDGDGPKLYAGGKFGRRIIRWDGTSWSTVGLGINDEVSALASWDDGAGPALFAGGSFEISPAGDSFLAKWGCRPKASVARRKL